MKSIQTAFIIWFVLGNGIRAHQVHKRTLGSSRLPPLTNKAAENETSNMAQTEDFVKASIITEDPTDIVVPIANFADANATRIQTGSSTETKEPISTTNEPVSIPLKSKTEPRPVFPQALMPGFISTGTEYHAGNSTWSIPLVSDPIEMLPSDYQPHLTRQIANFTNGTTSVLSELESEIGLLFEIADGIEHKHDISSKSGDSAEEIITVVLHPNVTNKSEDPKSEIQVDEVPFFEGFSPFLPIESFFSHLFRPQAAVIIETDSVLQRPSHLFAITNNSDASEKEHVSRAEEVLPKK